MKEQVKILLVGVGGYGATYLNPLLDRNEEQYKLVGMVEPYPDGAKRIGEALDKGVPLYNTMAEFYAEHDADLAVISTPIHLHTRMIIEALEHGSNVLCEKPLCGDDGDIEKLIEARDKAGKFVFIGYQWSHSDAILDLKRDIMAGVFGKPILLKTLILWPRDHGYYGRGTGWAGHLFAKDGSVIRDSIANNATAHYLHNIFFVLGDRIDTALAPVTVESEVYHANAIDSFDSADIRMTFANGAKAYYLSSHAVTVNRGPELEYRFEKGVVKYEKIDDKLVIFADFNDGTRKIYGDPNAFGARKMYIAADRILNGTDEIYCGIETAAVQTRVIASIHEKYPTIPSFDKEMIEDVVINDKTFTVCKGLGEKYIEAYESL